MTEDKDATIATLTDEHDELKGRKIAAIINGDGPMVLSKAAVRKLVEERDAARAEGFAQGIEAAAKVASGWLAAFQGVEIQRTSAREYACDAVMDIADGIRALSPAPSVDASKAPNHCHQASLTTVDEPKAPQADPVRESAQTMLARAIPADGTTLDQMRAALRDTPAGRDLINRGDTRLYWMNEGDVVTAQIDRALAQKGE
ncbi:hypothetical protein [Paracoccus homiensis]|uniref:Uncharacterized protein n=1 Tax=Paracoccus homiensis TaxID=364199 RepID=A0A1I0GZV8_9RHOB|nr:hypothetical protein [Paracoccus homiensis]SET76087.1 hypothetical protein SAMN04489858_109141 [Paracoccus homiensis]